MKKKQPWILGISGSHNGAAALLHGDRVVVAIQEERLVRLKRAWLYAGRPSAAVPYCLESAGISADDLDLVVCSGLLPRERRVGDSDNSARLHDVRQNPDLYRNGNGPPVKHVPHHLAHALSAFATSGFQTACVVVVDGGGSPSVDWLSSERHVLRESNGYDDREWLSIYVAEDGRLKAAGKETLDLPDWVIFDHPGSMPRFGSLGAMYDAVGWQIFGTFGEAGKVMGLAPYGVADRPPSDFYSRSGHSFRFHDAVPRAFAKVPRGSTSSAECIEKYANLAASVQHALEEGMLEICRSAHDVTGSQRLCLAGGVALNGVANERIIRELRFKDVHIVPAAEDSGAALGAAYWGLSQLGFALPLRRQVRDSCGRSYSSVAAATAADGVPLVCAVRSADLPEDAAAALADGQIVGWFQGKSELGPRALGYRSILCDPRSPLVKDILNATVKFREGFRPFAPVVLQEHAPDWFKMHGRDARSPFMLRVCEVRPEKRHQVPAITHVDGTSRLQTVTRSSHPVLAAVLHAFHRRTGVPLLLNTSFNVMGEPLVETPTDALWSLLFTGIDVCFVGDLLVRRSSADASALDLVPQWTLPPTAISTQLIPEGNPQDLSVNALRGSVGRMLPISRLVDEIDGIRNGWELWEAVPEASGVALLGSLAILRRFGVITLATVATGRGGKTKRTRARLVSSHLGVRGNPVHGLPIGKRKRGRRVGTRRGSSTAGSEHR